VSSRSYAVISVTNYFDMKERNSYFALNASQLFVLSRISWP
jgi:hypothetical protein